MYITKVHYSFEKDGVIKDGDSYKLFSNSGELVAKVDGKCVQNVSEKLNAPILDCRDFYDNDKKTHSITIVGC